MRAALIKPATAQGSKELRVLSIQPTVGEDNVAILDTTLEAQDAEGRRGLLMLQEMRDFPFGKHDEDFDAMTQAISQGKQNYFKTGNLHAYC